MSVLRTLSRGLDAMFPILYPSQPASLATQTQKDSTKPLRQSKRKRAQVSYMEPDLSDPESDLDSGYNSSSSDWASKKRPRAKRACKEKPIKPFPFLSLPAELRNRIYQLALQDPDAVVIQPSWQNRRRTTKRGHIDTAHSSGTVTYPSRYSGQANLLPRWTPDGTFRHPALRKLSPALLATNRQIHAEAKKVLYCQPLHFIDSQALHHFLAALSPATTALLTDITIHVYRGYLYDCHRRGIKKALDGAALTLLRGATGLKHLRFEQGFIDWCIDSERAGANIGEEMAQRIWRDGYFWLAGLAGGVDKAVEMIQFMALDNALLDTALGKKQHRQHELAVVKLKEAFADELRRLMMAESASARRGRR